MVRKIVLLSMALIINSAAFAQDANSIKFNFTADYFSKYIWRGQNLNDESVFQPAISASMYGLTATVWSSHDLTDENGEAGKFTEIDYSIDYTAAMPGVDNLSYSVGALYYSYPNTSFKASTELYAGLSLDVPLTPSFTIYRDVDEVKNGMYYQFAIGHTIEKIADMGEGCTCGLELGASTGYGNSAYNSGYFGINGGKMNDLTLTAGLPISMGSWTLKPSVGYSMMLSDGVRENLANPEMDSDNLWGGLSLSVDF